MAQYDIPKPVQEVTEVFTQRTDLTEATREAIRQAVESSSQNGAVTVAGASARVDATTGQPVIDFAQPPADPVTGAPPQVQVVLLDLKGLTGQVAAGTKVQVTLPENMRDAKVVTLDSDVDIEIVFNTVERVVTSGRGNDSITVLGNANTTLESATGNDTLITSGGNDSITSRGGHDSISSGAGNDTIITHSGNDTIDAGEGYDLLRLAGNRADYEAQIVDGELILVGAGRTVNVTNAEYIAFDDTDMLGGSNGVLTVSSNDAIATVMRFYEVLLDRSAEFGGAQFWTQALQNGMTAQEAAEFIIFHSQEWQDLNKDAGDVEAYVNMLYDVAFGRTPDEVGAAFWIDAINSGRVSQQEAAVFIIGSDEASTIHSGSVLYIDGWV